MKKCYGVRRLPQSEAVSTEKVVDSAISENMGYAGDRPQMLANATDPKIIELKQEDYSSFQDTRPTVCSSQAYELSSLDCPAATEENLELNIKNKLI
mmetsp:Transcript_33026/g.50607  ORF Transcript_33026/g.50607 Transcript_33026/m.50607 type:complete len:97 (+) Transcript_33026:325-615(+)|eukprot:CAMPEP_0170491224 /NCGR_PEP_ID=MMETSP0208-20121228/10640_1 /TAXON_ID=197538 /ORGANISM="Strombidium inclinatum, Strain S3" /LENGTH=96 /DNA_ID=CAMNT_0010766767 /DNA_START=325 /DNA_END=615 /DNA_ORIENTATION=+